MIVPVEASAAMRVAIIGAGAAGLVCARELSREGLVPEVFEQGLAPGGTWVYEPRTEGVHGSLYASLRTNLPRDLMAFDDFPFADQGAGDPRRFPGHAEVRRYLDAFARAHELLPTIRYGRTVTRLSPRQADGSAWMAHDAALPPAHWRLGWTDDDGAHEDRFDAVCVANGHYHAPRVPPLPGRSEFAGTVLHSHAYREPTAFTGRTVAVLGAKSSGIDLSLELARVARRVLLCGRDLVPADGLGPRGNLGHRPAIAALEPRSLRLVDGSRETDIDALLLCTGYRYVFPFLEPRAGMLQSSDEHPFPLHLDLVSAHADTLAFVGLPFKVVPFPLMHRQARLWARVLTGAVALPEPTQRLRLAAERDAQLAADGVPPRHRLRYGAAQWAYGEHLARLAGDPAPGRWRQRLNDLVSAARGRDPAGYRDEPFPGRADLVSLEPTTT
ncbi:MAG: NAD(P)-binding domain-containing protein [Nannocystaceae bacterium]